MEVSQNKNKSWFLNIFYNLVKNFFDQVDIKINGDKPEDIQIKNENVYYKLVKNFIGIDRLAMGDSYVNEDWDCKDLSLFSEKCFRPKTIFHRGFLFISKVLHSLPLLMLNMQSKTLSKKDIASHYDIGNDLFKLMLDKSMNYSCGYWQKNASIHCNEENMLEESLDKAQINKMLLIARKLNLKPGMKVLDVGCGWGYLAKFLALNFGVDVIGITISKEQIDYATKNDNNLNELSFLKLPNSKTEKTGKAEFFLLDYRDVKEKYDRIVSVGMIEHVGSKNYDEFFSIMNKCLKDDGIFLLHTIGIGNNYVPQVDPWINKYIFPNGMIPLHTQLINSTYGKFLIEDWHNFGMDYYRTLQAWKKNFEENWPSIEKKYGNKFKRIWVYYLSISAGLFKTRKLNLWQIVFSKDGLPNGYVSYR